MFIVQLFRAIIVALVLSTVSPIKCKVGHGQRGLMSSNEVSWTRTCPSTKYCFEATTSNIKKVQMLIDYPWDPYYSQYFIHSCGGDLGTELDYHPYRGRPRSFRTTPGAIKINVTTPTIITGHGGTAEFDLNYICRRDLCSDALPKFGYSITVLIASIAISIYLAI